MRFWFQGREFKKDEIVELTDSELEELSPSGLIEVVKGEKKLRVLPGGFGMRR